NGGGHIDHVVELGDQMSFIDQAWIRRCCRSVGQRAVPTHEIEHELRKLRGPDEVSHRCGAGRVESHRKHREAAVRVAFVDRLPDRQVVPAASPGSPAEEEHLAPSVRRQRVELTVEVGKREIGRWHGTGALLHFRPAFAAHRRAERPCVLADIVYSGLAEVSREGGEIELAASLVYPVALPLGRYRNASVSATKALRLELPPGGALELAEGYPQVIALCPGSIDRCYLVSVEDGLRHSESPSFDRRLLFRRRLSTGSGCSVEFLAG